MLAFISGVGRGGCGEDRGGRDESCLNRFCHERRSIDHPTQNPTFAPPFSHRNNIGEGGFPKDLEPTRMTVGDIIKEVFMLRGADLPAETVIMDMPEWDSLTHMSFIVRMEDEFKVQFTGDEIAAMRTIADVEKTLAARQAAGG